MSAAFMNYVRKVDPYVPGDQPNFPDMVKLNTNENPYPPAPAVEAALHDLSVDSLRLYPDPVVSKLNTAIADFYGVKPEQVFSGVGSDDVLAMCFLTFFNSKKPIFFPDVTYGFYPVWSELFQIPYEKKPLNDRFELVKEDYYAENGGIVFPNPNAPTGIALSVADIEDIIQHNPDSIVIVDEAYIDFGGTSVLPLIDKYDNLIVVQTFSKSRSMAGLRIGYALGNEKLIGYLNDVKYSYNSYTMDLTSIELGTCSIKADDYFKEMVKKVVDTRTWFVKEIEALGFTVLPSSANFVFATHKTIPAKEIFENAREHKIFVRYFDKPRIDNYLRISIGTDKEMQLFVAFLKTLL